MGAEKGGGGTSALGSQREVRDSLIRFNTGSDGLAPKSGTEMLHGPGFVVEMATSVDPVTQLIASVNDEDIAWPVLLRLCRELRWRMMDIETGRVLG